MSKKKTINKPINLYFCWEKRMSGGWGPVVYHGEVPPLGSNGKEAVPTRFPQQPVLIPSEFIDASGEPLYGKLKEAYPEPKEVSYENDQSS